MPPAGSAGGAAVSLECSVGSAEPWGGECQVERWCVRRTGPRAFAWRNAAASGRTEVRGHYDAVTTVGDKRHPSLRLEGWRYRDLLTIVGSNAGRSCSAARHAWARALILSS